MSDAKNHLRSFAAEAAETDVEAAKADDEAAAAESKQRSADKSKAQQQRFSLAANWKQFFTRPPQSKKFSAQENMLHLSWASLDYQWD